MKTGISFVHERVSVLIVSFSSAEIYEIVLKVYELLQVLHYKLKIKYSKLLILKLGV